MSNPKYLRVQNKVGRGPFMPNFTHQWIDVYKCKTLVPIFEAFPNLDEIIENNKGKPLFCASPFDCFSLWFSCDELKRLKKYGFKVYDATPCKVVAEHQTQVIMTGNQFKLKKWLTFVVFYYLIKIRVCFL